MPEIFRVNVMLDSLSSRGMNPDTPVGEQLDSLEISELMALTGVLPGEPDPFAKMTPRELADRLGTRLRDERAGLSPPIETVPQILPPARRDGRVVLQPVKQSHMGFLYGLATDDNIGFRWRFRSVPPDEEAFARSLWPGVLVQFCVISASEDRPIGLVVCYDADLSNGFAYVGATFEASSHGTGLAVAALELFVEYLFQAWPLRKIYFELPEFNYAQFSSGEGLKFELEGRLRSHEYFGGRYWDKLFLALYRP